MGRTLLDKATFLEYIEGMKEVYRAEKYHLLDFNCECIQLCPGSPQEWSLVTGTDDNFGGAMQAIPSRTTCSDS